MGLYNKMKTSPRLESEGIWLEVDDNRIRLARAGGKNTKFIAAAEKVARENKRALQYMNEEQGRKVFGKLFAELIVLDWLIVDPEGTLDEMGEVLGEHQGNGVTRYTRGIPGPNNEVKEFNVENVLVIFDDIPDLLKMIKETAEDASLFRQAILEEVRGN